MTSIFNAEAGGSELRKEMTYRYVPRFSTWSIPRERWIAWSIDDKGIILIFEGNIVKTEQIQ